ncbi:MAG: hypothetical protein WC794_04310 [Candidatus Doudnabacteria bacterium]|jgi:Tfp pilus assembly protein PilO
MNVSFPKNINLNISAQSKSFRNPMIEVVLLLIACGLFYWFMIMPKSAEITKQKAILSQTQADEKKIAGTVAELKKMVAKLSVNPKEIANLEEAMPLNGNVLRFRMLLENLSQSVGLSVSAVSVSNNSDEPWAGNKELLANPFGVPRSIQRLNATISVIGTYGQIVAFLDKLQTNGRVINVSSVNISSSENDNISIMLNLDSYYLAPVTKK